MGNLDTPSHRIFWECIHELVDCQTKKRKKPAQFQLKANCERFNIFESSYNSPIARKKLWENYFLKSNVRRFFASEAKSPSSVSNRLFSPVNLGFPFRLACWQLVNSAPFNRSEAPLSSSKFYFRFSIFATFNVDPLPKRPACRQPGRGEFNFAFSPPTSIFG